MKTGSEENSYKYLLSCEINGQNNRTGKVPAIFMTQDELVRYLLTKNALDVYGDGLPMKEDRWVLPVK